MDTTQLIELYANLPVGKRSIIAGSIALGCYIALRLFIRSANKASKELKPKKLSYWKQMEEKAKAEQRGY